MVTVICANLGFADLGLQHVGGLVAKGLWKMGDAGWY